MAGLSRVLQGRQASFGQMWRMTNRLQRAAALAVGAAVGVVAELKAGQGIGQVHAAGMVAGTCLSRRRAPPRRGSKYVRSGTKSEREVLSGCHRGFFLADPELSSSWRTFVQGVRQSHHFLPDPPFLSAKSAPICCRPSGEQRLELGKRQAQSCRAVRPFEWKKGGGEIQTVPADGNLVARVAEHVTAL